MNPRRDILLRKTTSSFRSPAFLRDVRRRETEMVVKENCAFDFTVKRNLQSESNNWVFQFFIGLPWVAEYRIPEVVSPTGCHRSTHASMRRHQQPNKYSKILAKWSSRCSVTNCWRIKLSIYIIIRMRWDDTASRKLYIEREPHRTLTMLTINKLLFIS